MTMLVVLGTISGIDAVASLVAGRVRPGSAAAMVLLATCASVVALWLDGNRLFKTAAGGRAR